MNKLLLCILTIGSIFITHASSLEAIENPPINLTACDENNDGIETFDLTINNAIVLGSQNPADFNITYHLTQADADNDTNPIPTPNAYTSSDATIFVRVEEIANTDLFEIGVFNVIVNPQPVFTTPGLVEVCDDIESGSDVDELATFDLNSLAIEATNGDPDLVISLHLTQSDANNSQDPLPGMYQNVSPGIQTIWMLVFDSTSNCSSVVPVTLIVNQLPSPSFIPDVMVCDDNEDGIGLFDLQLLVDDILNGETNVALSFHETLENAELGTSEIDLTLPYASIANPQTLYVRATDIDPLTATECFRIITITLITTPNPPIATPLPDLTQCNDGSDLALFDLTTNTPIILGPFDPTDYTVTYHESQMDASNDTLPIGDPANYLVSAPGTVIWARLKNETLGCFSIASFNLTIAESPILSQDIPFDYTFCEQFDGDDTMGDIDLTTLADDAGFLLVPQDTADFNISYHDTMIEAENNAFPIDQSSLFTVSDGDELFFRIENLNTGCNTISSVIFNVETRPETNPVSDIIQCATNPGVNGIPNQDIATFDITQQSDIITGGDPSTFVLYYVSIEDAQNTENSISVPTAYTNTSNPQTIYARAINSNSFCPSDIIEFQILVEPLPFIILEETCLDTENTTILNGTVETPIAGVSYAYTWRLDGELASLEPTITVDQEGVYEISCTATYNTGISCNYIASINITICPEDTDNDGVPDEEEDLNGNGDLEDDDTDNDDIPNYLDDDDDGDLVMTIDEITGIGAGIAPQDFIDTDDDMIENYLDDDDDGDLVLTRDEDYNNSGSPLDDDINDNGIPDFLDPDVALSTDEFTVTNFALYPNPSSSVIILENIDLDATITIYDTLGRAVLSSVNNNSTSYSMDISTLTNGVYFMEVDNRKPIQFIKN
ncbi:T9SS type A sorting domain-containing protein [uncultured Dokdonia sp.]|uniref:T9SS type A sorting domain-containing protein n=1 Tax=uncultured Dokdonia sp. TaxID=575653 RepID=UPI00262F4C98|nr:T9SS type A sorting domain-containing protein [uncultured Dokdonia sp.]